jgi:hypothetical protein
LESLFPKAYYDILEIDWDKIKIECKNDSRPNITQIYSWAFDIWDASVVNSFKDNTWLNTICSLYAMSYFLWMLARYYPSVWIWLKRWEKWDKIYPMINKMLNFIDEKFPEIITDFLGAPYEFENKDGY